MKKNIWVALAIIIVFAAEVYLLKKYGSGKPHEKVAFVFTIIGFYGISIGFIKRSTIGKTFSDLLKEMTSPNAALFVAGNFTFMGLFLNLLSIGFNKNRDPKGSLGLGCIGSIFLLVLIPFLVGYVVFHLLIILPLAYVSYVLSSAIIETISGASGDVVMIENEGSKEAKTFSLKNIITSDPESSKSFLIGVPSLLISFVIKFMSVFFYN